MKGEVKLATNKTMAQRVQDRLDNSGSGANPHVSIKTGDGPTRTHTNIHYSPNLDRNGGDKGGR